MNRTKVISLWNMERMELVVMSKLDRRQWRTMEEIAGRFGNAVLVVFGRSWTTSCWDL